MNLFSCLFPCALQHSWWNVRSDQYLSEEFTHRMGVNASTSPGTDASLVSGLGGDSCTSVYRDTIGIVR